MIPSHLGSRPPFQKSIESLKKNYGQISITRPDLDPDRIEKFDDRFGRQIVHFSQNKALHQILNKVKKVKPGLDPKIKPRSYWQDFTVR